MLDNLDPFINVSDVPYYDRMLFEKFNNIEKQYEEMIIRTVSNPDEFKDLLDIAIKIASDPGNFNVRSKYVTRLAESLFIK